MNSTRNEVYHAIDTERDYQDKKWNVDTTISKNEHETWEEWLVYINDYVQEAMHVASRLPRQDGNPIIADNVRKVAALCVAAMENIGAVDRK